MKWEYLQVKQPKNTDPRKGPHWNWKPAIDVLNTWGQDGWECFHIETIEEVHNRKTFYFKRLIEEKKKSKRTIKLRFKTDSDTCDCWEAWAYGWHPVIGFEDLEYPPDLDDTLTFCYPCRQLDPEDYNGVEIVDTNKEDQK